METFGSLGHAGQGLPPDAALKELSHSLSDLLVHDRLTGVIGPGGLVSIEHQPIGLESIQLQVWVNGAKSKVVRDLLWDALDVNLEARSRESFLGRTMEAGPLPTRVLASSRPLIRTSSNDSVPLFDFHPQRFRAMSSVGKAMAQYGSYHTPFLQSALQAAMNAVTQAEQSYTSTPFRSRYRGPASKRSLTDVAQLGTFFAAFHGTGRQIFDFPSALVERFRATDVDGIPLGALHLPYACQYLHFGRQDDLVLPNGWAPDGAYVALIGEAPHRVVQFALTFAPPSAHVYSRPQDFFEPTYIQAITEDRMSIGVGEAIEMVLADKIATLRGQMDRGAADAVAHDAAIQEFGVEMVDISADAAGAQIHGLPSQHATWTAMVKLVVNGLAYLSAYPDDTEVRWPDKTPKNLIAQATEGTHKQKQRASSKLAELGYTAINFCGRSFVERSMRDLSPACGEPQGPMTWVRGHWRRFAHGPGRTQRRLQWLMPFRRHTGHPSKEGDDEKGHIYLVS